MKAALPDNAKIAKEAKECVQECVSEFISFLVSSPFPTAQSPSDAELSGVELGSGGKSAQR